MDPSGGKNQVECGICYKKMKKKSLPQHMQTHDGPKITCNICGNYKTSRKTHLERHKISVHNLGGSSGKQCSFCKKQFPSNALLELHYRSHTKERPYFCIFCTQECRSLGDIKRHLKTHDSNREKTFNCQFCKKGFDEKWILDHHIRSHLGLKPHKCEICSKQFSRNSHLQQHKRIHSKEKPFKCEICEVRFSNKTYLAVHIRTHTKETPFVCKICKKGFLRSQALAYHSNIHTGTKPFVCDVCNKGFSHPSDLRKHRRIHTDRREAVFT